MRSLLFLVPYCFAVSVQAQQGDLAANTASAPPTVEILFKNGEEAYRTGAYTKAIALFDQVLAKDADHLNAYLQRGFCHSVQQNYTAAVADFTEVIKRRNDHLWAYTSRGGAYNRLGKPELAMRDFDAVLALDPKDQEAYNNRGWAKKTLGDLKGACEDWRTSKKLGNGEARIILTNNRCK
ncbi:MAG TPA: tetratricopeptide repeat protein [Flavobacteriales bacterium]